MKDFEKDQIIKKFLQEHVKTPTAIQKEAEELLWNNIKNKNTSMKLLKRGMIGTCIIAAAAAVLVSVFGTFEQAHNPNLAEILAEFSGEQGDESDDAAIYDNWEELGEYVELQREKNL